MRAAGSGRGTPAGAGSAGAGGSWRWPPFCAPLRPASRRGNRAGGARGPAGLCGASGRRSGSGGKRRREGRAAGAAVTGGQSRRCRILGGFRDYFFFFVAMLRSKSLKAAPGSQCCVSLAKLVRNRPKSGCGKSRWLSERSALRLLLPTARIGRFALFLAVDRTPNRIIRK